MPLLTFPARYLAWADLTATTESGVTRFRADPEAPKQLTAADADLAADQVTEP